MLTWTTCTRWMLMAHVTTNHKFSLLFRFIQVYSGPSRDTGSVTGPTDPGPAPISITGIGGSNKEPENKAPVFWFRHPRVRSRMREKDFNGKTRRNVGRRRLRTRCVAGTHIRSNNRTIGGSKSPCNQSAQRSEAIDTTEPIHRVSRTRTYASTTIQLVEGEPCANESPHIHVPMYL